MSSDHVRNVSGLLSYAKEKSKAVNQRIDSAIGSLLKQGLPINFNSVATLAGISKTTLYNNPDYRARIQSLRQSANSVPFSTKRAVTDKSKDVILAAKNKRIKELETEVERLSSILKRYYAAEYEKY